ETGFTVMAVADGPRRAAEIEPMVRQLAWQAWERRRGFAADLLGVDDAIRRALGSEGGPFVLSGLGERPGGGSAPLSPRSRRTARGRALPATASTCSSGSWRSGSVTDASRPWSTRRR